jgi:hypothetical protein
VIYECSWPVGYWICTVLIGFAFLSGGAVDLLHGREAP